MEKAKLSKLLLIILTFFVCLITNAPTYSSEQKRLNIIFDLGGVLIENSKTEFIKLLGWKSIVQIMFHREKLMNELSKIEPFTPTTTIACDERGKKLPPLLCDWLKGVPSAQLLERLEQNFSDGALLPAAQIILSPEKIARTFYLYEQGQEFVNYCRSQGYKIYILSNLDCETYAILHERYKSFFDLFDGIVISGECHLIKPDPAIFSYILDKYNLDPSECVFIDDQKINVDAARSCGIYAILCPRTGRIFSKPDFDTVNNGLIAWQSNMTFSEMRQTA